MVYGQRTNRRYMFGDSVVVKVIGANRENSTVDFMIINDKDNNENNNSNIKIGKNKFNKKEHKKNNKGKRKGKKNRKNK